MLLRHSSVSLTKSSEVCIAYIDDLLIASSSPQEHQEHLRAVASRGFTYLLTCVPEAIPIGNIAAEMVAEAFVSGWIARFGTPSTSLPTADANSIQHLGVN